jgi:hypothetical protein
VKIVLLGLNHDLQWKDPTGDLRKILEEQFTNLSVDLVAEEASGLPTTVAQRLACKYDKPWIDIDLSMADRKLAGIYDELLHRKCEPLDLAESVDCRHLYLLHEDGIRETEWVSRILRSRVDAVLCLCGFLHVDPFRQKLEERGCSVEHLKVAELAWFQNLYGKYSIVEENGNRWFEVQHLVL